MKRNLLILLILFTINATGKEITISSIEETLLSYGGEVLATNCAPSHLGSITNISGFRPTTRNEYLLKFSPRGHSGSIVCNTKIKRKGIVSITFDLRKNVKNPMIEIPIDNVATSTSNLMYFDSFVQGKTQKFTRIPTKGVIRTRKFRYKFIDKFQVSPSTYLYKIQVTPKRKKQGNILLDREILTPIIFSHYKNSKMQEIAGISREEKSYLYLMTKQSFEFNHFKNYLR
jgi:hypothetical protein